MTSLHSNFSTVGSPGYFVSSFACTFPRLKRQFQICSSTLPRVKMSNKEKDIHRLPPLPDQRVVVGCGTVSTDYLATVASFPQPDDKIRSLELKVQGGGNVGNALTGAARLGLNPRLISKVANDGPGRRILSELEADGVDVSYVVVSERGNSPLTYVIVDKQTKTRTCIHSPGNPPMMIEDLPQSKLISALAGATIVYFDVRLPETAIRLAKEAKRLDLPILVDAERKREGLDELLSMANYVVCSDMDRSRIHCRLTCRNGCETA
eukprot:TRINITY_DN5821_c0_g1_i8.p1 TRINITY_DN5821_c0_g1~~TRINITY_DN5821_c0_g1_i8.p1  ORF type:complete len:265 (-),score=46.97 TRINITY_DN5821_c0_g1_i8:573-1367(-)